MGRKNRPAVKKTPYERPERYNRKKDRRNKHKRAPKEPLIRLSQIPYGIIILAYIFVVTFTPNWMALDTNASKFMTLSLLNLLAFVYLLTRRDIKNEPGVLMRFFDTRAGLAYGAFLVIALLSFTQATNILESVVMFTKIFSVFSAVFILSVILMRDVRYVKFIVLVCVGLLLFDSISVFYYINQFINGEIDRINLIKSVYSNKNILASAIFVKIPFALYLWMFYNGWLKRIGLVAMAMGMLATFFMLTRGFYVGLIVITLVMLVYSLYNYFLERTSTHIRLLAGYLGALVFALLMYTVVQSNLYPARDRERGGVGTQLGTIGRDSSSSQRIDSWIWSLKIIKDKPLGVGVGNWKINILEYENQQNTGYIYLYKAHNDFIEMMTETGIIGGLIYIAIFVFVFWSLLRAYLNRQQRTQRYRHLFLSGFGLMFYGFDAFFNFPIDRPEIQMLFALFLSIGIVTTLKPAEQTGEEKETATAGELESDQQKKSMRPLLAKALSAVFIVLMLGSSYVLYTNFQSSKLQRVIYQDIMRGRLDHDADMFLAGFPFIPNVSIWGESINAMIARYLLNENRHREVIDLLGDDGHINPYDGRREFFMATAYNNLGIKDSALVYSLKTYEIKPHYFRNIHLLTSLLLEQGRTDEVGPYLDRFLAHDQSDKQAYLYATGHYIRQGELEKAWQHIDTAYQLMPNDSLIQQQYRYVEHQLFISPHQDTYRRAVRHYNNNRFAEALPHLNEYIDNTPFDPNVYRMRAFANYHLENHRQTIEDIDDLFDRGHQEPGLINLRGVCYQALGEQERACEDFREAMEAGNASGEQNYRNFCSGNR